VTERPEMIAFSRVIPADGLKDTKLGISSMLAPTYTVRAILDICGERVRFEILNEDGQICQHARFEKYILDMAAIKLSERRRQGDRLTGVIAGQRMC